MHPLFYCMYINYFIVCILIVILLCMLVWLLTKIQVCKVLEWLGGAPGILPRFVWRDVALCERSHSESRWQGAKEGVGSMHDHMQALLRRSASSCDIKAPDCLR
jgi:hypothetical protein